MRFKHFMVLGLLGLSSAAHALEGTARPVVDPTADLQRMMSVPSCPPGSPITVSGTRLACMNNYIVVGGICFRPTRLVVCNWNWSGSGNDDSTYVVPMSQNGAAFCASVGRTYQREHIVLGQCPDTSTGNNPPNLIPNSQATVTINGQCYRPKNISICNWNWSGSGNDNGTFSNEISQTPQAACAAQGRTFQGRYIILANCN